MQPCCLGAFMLLTSSNFTVTVGTYFVIGSSDFGIIHPWSPSGLS